MAGHRMGVSETEYLLSQIRNNINTLKAYQPYAGEDAYTNFTNKPKHPKNKSGLQIQTLDEESLSSQRLTTDPNLSPYSKDL